VRLIRSALRGIQTCTSMQGPECPLCRQRSAAHHRPYTGCVQPLPKPCNLTKCMLPVRCVCVCMRVKASSSTTDGLRSHTTCPKAQPTSPHCRPTPANSSPPFWTVRRSHSCDQTRTILPSVPGHILVLHLKCPNPFISHGQREWLSGSTSASLADSCFMHAKVFWHGLMAVSFSLQASPSVRLNSSPHLPSGVQVAAPMLWVLFGDLQSLSSPPLMHSTFPFPL